MMTALLVYFVAVVYYITKEARASHMIITLDIDRDYARKANHAAIYGSIADWNQIMDACSYFWEGRR